MDGRTASNAISHHWRKYPDLTNKLLVAIARVLKAQGSLTDLSFFGLRLLSLELHLNDPRLMELMLDVCQPEQAVDLVNKEPDLQAVGHGLRFCFNYFRRLRRKRIISHNKRGELIRRISWEELITRWKAEPNFSKVLDSLQWAQLIDGRVVRQFLTGMKKNDLNARFASLTQAEKLRFLGITYQYPKVKELRTMLDATAVVLRGKLYSSTLLDEVDRARGIAIDDGALAALHKGYGLLPVGVIEAHGNFEREEVISIFNSSGKYVGAGITFYDAGDVEKIKGLHSSLIGQLASHDSGKHVMNARAIWLNKD